MNQKINNNLIKIIFGIVITSIIVFSLLYPVRIFADDDLKEWKIEHITGKFFYSIPPKPDKIFNFPYEVINGTIGNLTINQLEGTYVANVQSADNGIFEFNIPRDYPLSNGIVTANSHASIMINSKKLDLKDYTFVSTKCFFKYSIPFSGKSIINLEYVPFPEHLPYLANKVPLSCISETIYNSTITNMTSSPLKQIKLGVLPEDVACNDNMTLVMKKIGNSPACVTPQSANNLVLLGWAKNPLSEFLLSNKIPSNMSDEQKNTAYYNMMNYPDLRKWSTTGWMLIQIRGMEEVPSLNIHRTFVDLYLPPHIGNPKVYCNYGWYAWLTVNIKTLQVENGTYPEPDSCTKQFQ